MARLLILPNPRRVLPAAVIVVFFFGSLLILLSNRSNPIALGPSDIERSFYSDGASEARLDGHPVSTLIRDARAQFQQLLAKHTMTLEQTAARYRERRGRHPPPGFDQWFAAAKKSNAVIVEEFFDRIYHDLNPLWALDPAEMRRKTHKQPFVIRVRDGKVMTDTEEEEPPYRVRQWAQLVKEIMPHLPDLDMAVNVLDESRIMAPWEKVNEYVAEEIKKRSIFPASEAISQYSGVQDVEGAERYEPNWIRDQVTKMWNFVAPACPPDSPSRNTTAMEDLTEPASFPHQLMPYMHRGYVQNFTASQDVCQQPHLRSMHGTFTEPVSMAVTTEYLPMFGECKLTTNNEMLIPGAVYLDDERIQYSGGRSRGSEWARKKDRMVWRGSSSGARNKPHNWWHIHRFRFMQMLNATTVASVEAGSSAKTFELPLQEKYNLAVQKQGKLGEWVSTWSNVGFTDILCDPPDWEDHWWHGHRRLKNCHWARPDFSVADELPMKEQYSYKYLPDVDGQTFSGRYRAFLLSTSMVLKSTIYAEWHDTRLFPWVHFAPFDNSYMDIYGVMDYFLRGHDDEARRIAEEGKAWAETVLRREDMRLYMWRLLLEYARVVDDKRDRLAFVGDLEGK
jgi:hypothetical protein